MLQRNEKVFPFLLGPSLLQQARYSFNAIWIFEIKRLIYHFLTRKIMLSQEDSGLIWNTRQPQRKLLETNKITGKTASLFTNSLTFCLYSNTTMIFDPGSFTQRRQTSFELLFCCNVTIPLLWPLVSCKIQQNNNCQSFLYNVLYLTEVSISYKTFGWCSKR